MTVTIGTTTFPVIECFSTRFPNGKQTLTFTVDKTEIGHDALYDLIKSNTGNIVQTFDDETTKEHSGYGYTFTLLTTETSYKADIECIAETEQALGEMETKVNEQNAEIDSLSALINSQNEIIATQSNLIDENLMLVLDMMSELI